MPNSALDVILNVLKKGTGATDTEKELTGVEKAARVAGSALASFDTSSKAVWSTLTSGQRAAEMTAQEMGELATSLGVATDAEVQATIKMNQLTAAWEKGEISSEDLAAGINDLGSETEEASGGVDKLSNVIDVAMVAAVARGAIEVGKMAFELGEMGAQSLRTKASFDAISGGAANAAANLEAMQEATRGALSEQSAMESANQLLSMGLASNAEELANVTEMAVRLGGAMGGTASESIESFSLLLANQSIPRLDTFGISASNVRSRILELQEATPGLSREMAFMAAVTEEGKISMERLGPATDDLALSFERTEAKAADLTAEFAERLAPAVSAVLDTGMLLLTWNEQIADAQEDHAEATLVTAASYEEYVAELMRAAGASGMMVDSQGNLITVTQEYDLATGTLLSTTEQLVQANFSLSEAQFNVARTTDAATVGMAGAADVMRGSTAVALEAAAASEEFAAAQATSAQESANLATSLMDATSGQIASRLIGMLDPEKMGADAYGTAVAEIGVSFGLMDETSIALAENMGELAESISDGTIAAEDADEALAALIEDAEDGEIGINRLAGEFEVLADETLAVGSGLRDASGGMQGISTNAPGAVAGLDDIGGSASLAAGGVVDLADGLGTTEAKLSAIVAGSPWTFSVIGLSGETEEDLITDPLARRTTTTDNRRYNSRATTITNIITDPMAAAVAMEEQRRLTNARIERGF